MTDATDEHIIAAHEAGDIDALARLYLNGASQFLDRGRTDEGAFFLTQAYVFALEAGLPEAIDIEKSLRKLGRI